MSGEFVLYVYEKEDWNLTQPAVVVRDWVTELPQIGHTIQFSHETRFIRAKIQDIIWNLGDSNNWMGHGGTVHIVAYAIN